MEVSEAIMFVGGSVTAAILVLCALLYVDMKNSNDENNLA
jgi:hypothetical protein